MRSKLKRRIDHLRFMCQALKNWDFYTKDNTGIFQNRIKLILPSGELLLTKPELEAHIKRVKQHRV